MALHPSTFDFYAPTEEQRRRISIVRQSAKLYAQVLEEQLQDGPDKTYALRHLREVAMWAVVSITRQPDGTPRS